MGLLITVICAINRELHRQMESAEQGNNPAQQDDVRYRVAQAVTKFSKLSSGKLIFSLLVNLPFVLA